MPNNLPPTWSWVKLGDVSEINPKLSTNGIIDDTEVSFLPMKAVEELTGKIDLSDERKFSKVKKGYTYFGEGDVIFAKITPCMENGKVAITTKLKNGIGFGSTEFHVLRPQNILLNKFLFHYLIQSSYRKLAQRSMTGTAGQLRVPKSFVENSEIPLPPLPEQKKIVEKIEELFSGLDSGVASLKKAKEQIKFYRQSVLASAFNGKLIGNGNVDEKTGLPKGWESMKFVEFCKLQRGYDLVLSKIVDGEYPVVTSSGIKGYHKEFRANGPCLITGRSGGVGNIHFLKVEKYWPHNTVLFVKDFCGNYPEFMYYFFQQFSFKSFSASTTIPTLDRKQLYNEIVKVPPYKEQTQIAEEIESRFAGSEALEREIDESLEKSEALRQSILKQAFEGKLVN